MGFGKKLYLGSFGTILITILIIAGVNFFQSKTSFLSKGKAGIQEVNENVAQSSQVSGQVANEISEVLEASQTTISSLSANVKEKAVALEEVIEQLRAMTSASSCKKCSKNV